MSINLLPWREAYYQQQKRRLMIELILAAFLVVLALSICYMKNARSLSDQALKINAIQAEISSLSEDYNEAIAIEKNNAENAKKIAFLNAQINQNQQMIAMLNEIIAQLPDAIYLIQIYQKSAVLHLEGRSPSHAELAQFLENIKLKLKKQPIVTQTSKTEDQKSEIGFDVGYKL